MLSFFMMMYDSIRQAKPTVRSNFGVGRYNTRLNFYLFEVSRLHFIQRKGFYLDRFSYGRRPSSTSLNLLTLVSMDTTLFSYHVYRK